MSAPAYSGETERAIGAVALERRRQIEGEGYAPARDDAYADGALEGAAACYAFAASIADAERGHFARFRDLSFVSQGLSIARRLWPGSWAPPKLKERRRDLVRAGALIIAAIERIDRKAPKPAGVCGLCGEPMPAGEEMFKYHGYSGPCPTPARTHVGDGAHTRFDLTGDRNDVRQFRPGELVLDAYDAAIADHRPTPALHREALALALGGEALTRAQMERCAFAGAFPGAPALPPALFDKHGGGFFNAHFKLKREIADAIALRIERAERGEVAP